MYLPWYYVIMIPNSHGVISNFRAIQNIIKYHEGNIYKKYYYAIISGTLSKLNAMASKISREYCEMLCFTA